MTPLTAAIVWAVVATVLGISACIGWRQAEKVARTRLCVIKQMEKFESWLFQDRWKAKRELNAIKRQRSDATRRGNETRKARRAAMVKTKSVGRA